MKSLLLTIFGLLMIPVWLVVGVAALLTFATCTFIERFILGDK
jgi:hypothetical protein